VNELVRVHTGGYYGHYQGHYLSATAMMFNATSNIAVKNKARAIVAALAEVQQAWATVPGANGYIFPFGPNVFDMIETRCGFPGPVVDYSVPYYTLHKVRCPPQATSHAWSTCNHPLVCRNG
jgi:hypothetical protein